MFNPSTYVGTAGPGFLCKVGSFTLGNATITVSDVGFQPKAVLFFWSGTTGTVDSVVNGTVMAGYGAVTATDQFSWFIRIVDSQGTTSYTSFNENNSCIVTSNGSSGSRYGFGSFTATGFTLSRSEGSLSSRIHYIAIGGTNAQAKIGWVTIPTTTGNFDTTSVGFDPDCVFLTYTGTNIGAAAPDGRFNLGAITKNGQALLDGVSDSGVSTTNAKTYSSVGEYCLGYANDPTLSSLNRTGSGSIISGGFRINVLQAPGASVTGCTYLAISGGRCKLGSFTSKTNTSGFSEALGFSPTGALLVSNMTAGQSGGTVASNHSVSIGAFSSTTDRRAMAFMDLTGLGTSSCAPAQGVDDVYLNLSTANPPALQGSADVTGLNTSSMSLVMTDADPSENLIWYVAFG